MTEGDDRVSRSESEKITQMQIALLAFARSRETGDTVSISPPIHPDYARATWEAAQILIRDLASQFAEAENTTAAEVLRRMTAHAVTENEVQRLYRDLDEFGADPGTVTP